MRKQKTDKKRLLCVANIREFVMKTKFSAIFTAVLMLVNISGANASNKVIFPIHTPMQDGLTQYRISNGARYSKWASYLEKKYNIFFSDSDKLFQHYYGERTPTGDAKRWEIMNILYLINEDKFDNNDSYRSLNKEFKSTPDGPFF